MQGRCAAGGPGALERGRGRRPRRDDRPGDRGPPSGLGLPGPVRREIAVLAPLIVADRRARVLPRPGARRDQPVGRGHDDRGRRSPTRWRSCPGERATRVTSALVEHGDGPTARLGAMAPLLVVLGAACVAVLVEAFLPRHQRLAGAGRARASPRSAWAGLIARALRRARACGHHHDRRRAGDRPADAVPLGHAPRARAGQRAADRGPLGRAGRRVRGVGGLAVAAAGGSAGGAYDPTDPDRSYGSPDQAPTMQTEVFPFMLFALGGMMTFVAANDLLTMFVALEVLSLPLYLMCGLARRRRLLSQEAAVKYFLLGAFASAFFLYGLALIYGYAGSVRLADIAIASAGSARSDTLLFAGLALLVVGLLFKGSVGPFHTWTPDVYQGAPDAGHGVHGGLHQGRRVRRDPARAVRGVRRHPLGVARRAVGRRHRLDGGRRRARAHPDRHQADGRLLLDRPRRVPAGRGDGRHARRESRARCSTCWPTASPRSPCSV